MNVVNFEKLENLLQAHWTEFFNVSEVLHVMNAHIRNTTFKKLTQQQMPKIQNKIVITNISLKTNMLEAWFEFSVPKDNGVVIGTLVGNVDLNGNLNLVESYGTHFVPEIK